MDRFFDNLRQMTSWRPSLLLQSYLVVLISLVAPIVIGVILFKELYLLVHHHASPLQYGSYHFPPWTGWLGWAIAGLSISAIPLGALHQLATFCCQSGYTKPLGQRLSGLFQPTEAWWQNADNSLGHRLKGSLKKRSSVNGRASVPIDHVNPSFKVTEF